MSLNLNIDLETATKLSDAYSKAYPGIIEYQKAVQAELNLKGYVTNLYGRRYYIENSTNFYKGNNYVIQGTGADALKEVEIKIYEYLKDKKSRFILPIHDELAIEVAPDEVDFVPKKIKELMESVGDVVKSVPMIAEVEATETNWAEKKEVAV